EETERKQDDDREKPAQGFIEERPSPAWQTGDGPEQERQGRRGQLQQEDGERRDARTSRRPGASEIAAELAAFSDELLRVETRHVVPGKRYGERFGKEPREGAAEPALPVEAPERCHRPVHPVAGILDQ